MKLLQERNAEAIARAEAELPARCGSTAAEINAVLDEIAGEVADAQDQIDADANKLLSETLQQFSKRT